MKLSSILGMNSRTMLYAYKFNSAHGKKVADSKILTARILRKAEIPCPRMFAKFRDPEDILHFNWDCLPSSFALKPSRGLGGEGIIVVKRRAKDGNGWMSTQRERVTIDDLKLHTLDILEGAFSMGNIPDVAFIQEYVGRHKTFRRYAYRGTPDIRIIVFNKVPVMAMLRLPTKESGGRANLHQGAIGVGVDIATGITTRAIWHGKLIRLKPGTKRKLHGIRIPDWSQILEVASRTQVASGLGYLGVDIVLHPERGPMVLEINAQPGLQIQLANMTGLRRRLEKVEDLRVKDVEHGVRIAKALFAETFIDRVTAEEGLKIVKAVEEVKVLGANGKREIIKAKIDTGAWASSIDRQLAESLGILTPDRILLYKKAVSALGHEKRPVINVSFFLAGKKVKAPMTVSNRRSLTYKMIIGRTELAGFMVKPEIEGVTGDRQI